MLVSENLTHVLWNVTETKLSPTLGSCKCTVMSTFNLAETEWISMSCLQKIHTNVVCSNMTAHGTIHTDNQDERNVYCEQSTVRTNQSCYIFAWFDGRKMSVQNLTFTCKIRHNSNLFNSNDFTNLEEIFVAVSHKTFAIITHVNNSKLNVVENNYHRFWFKVTQSQKITKIHDAKGFQVCLSSKKKTIMLFVNIFTCADNQYISSSLVLDGKNDCQDNYYSNGIEDVLDKDIISSDEQCFSMQMSCPHFCEDPYCRCSPLHYKTKEGHCVSYLHNFFSNTSKLLEGAADQYFLCSGNQTISNDLLDDLIVDCEGTTKDEPRYAALLTNLTFHNCEKAGQIPCVLGHTKCYSIGDICVFQLDAFGHLTPCRVGSHLEFCKKFECNIQFKCPKSYCISWHLACDGKWDCPFGEDEYYVLNKCGGTGCGFLLKCQLSSLCVHPENICDYKLHCPFGDDEQMCYTITYSCPDHCHCFNLALSCVAVFLTDTQFGKFSFRSLHIIQSGIVSLSSFGALIWLENANFSQNNIIQICNTMKQFPSVVCLDIRQNYVTEVFSKCFHNLMSLKWIILRNNQLQVIRSQSFTNLQALKYIDISHNFLSRLDLNTFENISDGFTLELSSNFLFDIELNVFHTLYLNHLVTDFVPLCCITTQDTTCFSKITLSQHDVACSELLPSKIVKINCIFFFFVLLTCNCSSLLVHSQTRHRLGMYNIIVRAISIGHITSAIYYGILFAADLYYQRYFVIKQTLWSSNFICILAFTSYKFFNILLPSTFALLSFGRMMIILFPLSSKFKSESFVGKNVRIGIILSLCLSASFASLAGVSKVRLNKLCSHFTGPHHPDIIQNLLVSVIQLVFAIFVPACDICMLISLDKQQKALEKLGTGKRVKQNTLLKLTVTSVPNVLCWISFGTMVVFFQVFSDFNTDIFVWPITLIMPINGTINPLIFLGMKLQNVTSLQQSPSSRRNQFLKVSTRHSLRTSQSFVQSVTEKVRK